MESRRFSFSWHGGRVLAGPWEGIGVFEVRIFGWIFGTTSNHGNLRVPPQCHPPQEIAGLIKGLLTIGFP